MGPVTGSKPTELSQRVSCERGFSRWRLRPTKWWRCNRRRLRRNAVPDGRYYRNLGFSIAFKSFAGFSGGTYEGVKINPDAGLRRSATAVRGDVAGGAAVVHGPGNEENACSARSAASSFRGRFQNRGRLL
jgi:hypothetical protein